jgi:YD repeat-containing protein
MVGIFMGRGSGFERSSAADLGTQGLLGGSSIGRGGDQVFVNGLSGNLLISKQAEFLVGRGPDVAIARTYNSLGNVSDDNGDNWRQSTDRRIYNLVGTVGTGGSKVTRVSGDGSEIVYEWNGSAYHTTDGAGAYDKLTHANGVWTWTDGGSQITEKYAATTAGSGIWRIAEQADTDGNRLSFRYTGDQLSRVTAADGGYVEYSWAGNAISQVATGYTDLQTGAAQVLTRTRYGYDSSGRLATVTVDLSPEDNGIADGKTYVTTYTYDGASKRIASISQSDGSKVSFTYDGSASPRITSVKQWLSETASRVTAIAYNDVDRVVTITDPSGAQTLMGYDAIGRASHEAVAGDNQEAG